jgi:hypothetical protein
LSLEPNPPASRADSEAKLKGRFAPQASESPSLIPLVFAIRRIGAVLPRADAPLFRQRRVIPEKLTAAKPFDDLHRSR